MRHDAQCSHFLFLSERILGPLELVWAEPEYPAQEDLCETHVAARLVNGTGLPLRLWAVLAAHSLIAKGHDKVQNEPKDFRICH